MFYIFRQKGFHLMEMLIVLALIVISSHWALGNYEQIIAKHRRQSAQSALYELALALEEYALENQTYAGATLQLLGIKAQISSKQYILTIDKANDYRFIISARPLSPQSHRDKNCGILSLSSEGDKRASATLHPLSCWSN